MKWWGWLIVALAVLTVVSIIVVIIKATLWVIVSAALLIALVWLLIAVGKTASDMFNF